MINGVTTKTLNPVPDERGRVMEIFRCDDPFFESFGQVYITTAYPGAVKAWHLHHKQIDHFTVIKGMAKVVLYDDREGSSTRCEINEFFIGEHNPLLVRIPNLVYHGFKCISETECMIINVPNLPYKHGDPDEERVPADQGSIPYDWSRKNR